MHQQLQRNKCSREPLVLARLDEASARLSSHLERMRNDVESLAVQESALKEIRMISAERANHRLLIDANCAEIILAAMNIHSVSSAIQEDGCMILQSVSESNRLCRDQIIERDGVPITLRGIIQHIHSAKIFTSGCRLLWNLGIDERGASQIVQAGGIAVIINGLKRHLQSSSAYERAAGALSVIAISNQVGREEIVQLGGIDILITGMKTHLSSELVQALCCSALSSLSEDYQTQSRIAQTGGAEAAVNSLHRHQTSESAQWNACRVLGSLSVTNECRVFVVRVNGIAEIISAMNRHVSAELLYRDGFHALSNLALDHDNIPTITSAGGIHLAIRSLKQYLYSQPVILEACILLSVLMTNNSETQLIVAKLGGIEAVRYVLWGFLDESSAIESAACAVIATLCAHVDNKALILQVDCITTVMDAMRKYLAERDVQQNGSSALRNYLEVGNDESMFIRGGGIEVIVSAMMAHIESPEIQENGCRIFANLAAVDGNVIRDLTQADAITGIVSAMRAHLDNVTVQATGCAALYRLSLTPDCRSSIVISGAVEVATTALQHHSHQELQEHVSQLLSLLSTTTTS